MPEDESQKRYNHILEIIDKRLVPDEGAKKARGEVFTPLDLVREMLFGIRKSSIGKAKTEIWGLDNDGNFIDEDEKDRVGGIPLDVWRNPKSTFLDPANGIGNFPVVAFYMLDYQLGKHGKSVLYKGTGEAAKKRRREHIVKNMLYMIELNKGNVNTSRKIFEKLAPGVKANICCANTLQMTDEKLKREFGINRFDVVMGNPPYNSGGVKSSGKGEEDYETIWYHFVKQSLNSKDKKPFPGALNILNKNGYICFIHPSSWLHTGDKANMNKVILSEDLQFVRIYTDIQAGKLFSGGANLRLTYYILKHTNVPNDNIIIFDTDNILETLKRSSIVSDEFTIYPDNNKLLNKLFSKFGVIGNIKDTDGLPYLKSNKIKGNISRGDFKYIVSHTQKGVEVCKSSTEFKDLKKAKIIIKGTRNLFHFDDFSTDENSGEYGVYGNWGFYITDTIKNLNKFSKFMDTNIAKIIMTSTKEDQSFIEPKYLPDIRQFEGEINDKTICDKLDIDYNHIKSFKFIENNQKIASTTDGCSTKGRTTEKSKAKGGSRKSNKKSIGKTRKLKRN